MIAPSLRERLWRVQARHAPYLFLSPFAALFAAFYLLPLAQSLWMSVHQYAGSRSRGVGGANFRFVLGDDLFWLAVLNTAAYTAVGLLIQVPLALGLAMLLDRDRLRGRGLLRFAFFAPHLIGPVFVAVIFGLLLARQGPVNRLLHLDIDWLRDPIFARPAVILAGTWLAVGFGMIYLLAALQSVDGELYDAASVDGAGGWQRFRHVTLPGIWPVLSFLLLSGVIGGLQLFDLPYVLFNGPGPAAAGLTIVSYLLAWVELGEMGTASAVGWILTGFVIGAALLRLRRLRGSDPS